MSVADMVPCRRCSGEGVVPLPDISGKAETTCPTCHGRGLLNRPERRPHPGGPQ